MDCTMHAYQIKNQIPQITNHKSNITNHKLQITNHKSQITNHKPQITNHKSQITNHAYVGTEIDPQRLTVDALGVTGGQHMYHRFDHFNLSYNPVGEELVG
jgi:CD68 antigen